MKKIIYVILLIVMSLGLVACGGGNDDQNANKFSITFKQNGYEDVVKKVDIGSIFDNNDIPPIQGDGKTGYVIAWSRIDFSTVTGDIVVTAVETPKNYILTIIADNNSDSITKSVTYDASYSIDTPSKTGYTFNKWINVEDDSEFNATGTWQIDKNLTIKALWTENNVTFSFKNLALSNIPSTSAYTFTTEGDSVVTSVRVGSTFIDFEPVKEGYAFASWTNEDGVAIDLNNVMVSTDLTIYAKFVEKPASKYVLTFIEKNCAPVSIVVDNDSEILAENIPSTTEINAGYDVLWNFEASEVVNSDTKIYVKYEAKEFKIYYNISKETIKHRADEFNLIEEGDKYYQVVKYNESYSIISDILDNNNKLVNFKLSDGTIFTGANQYLLTENVNLFPIYQAKTIQEIIDDDMQWSPNV